jgi:hypothetical protein
MELWEGAILAVGGIFLVGYMSQKNQAALLGAQSAAASATTVTPAGTSNTSNLTNITNQAGGQPTVIGEPLEPPQAPIFPGAVVGPGTTGAGGGSVQPLPVPPTAQMPANPVVPRGTIAQPARGFLGSLSGQSNPALPATPNNPAAWGKFTPVVRPIDVHL